MWDGFISIGNISKYVHLTNINKYIYVNGEYAPKGVDQTEITEGEKYSFRAEK